MLVSNWRKISGRASTTIEESARTRPTAPASAAVRRFISTRAPGILVFVLPLLLEDFLHVFPGFGKVMSSIVMSAPPHSLALPGPPL